MTQTTVDAIERQVTWGGYSATLRYEICVEETDSRLPWRRYRGFIRTNQSRINLTWGHSYSKDRAAGKVESSLFAYFRSIGCDDWYWASVDKSSLDGSS